MPPLLPNPHTATPTARCSECNLLSQHSAITPTSSSSPSTHGTTARSPPGTTCRTRHHPSPQSPAPTHPPSIPFSYPGVNQTLPAPAPSPHPPHQPVQAASCLFSLLPPPGRPNPASAPPSSRTPPPPRIAANPPATPLPPPAPLTGLRPPTSTPSTPTTARARLHSFLLPGGKPKTHPLRRQPPLCRR